MRLNVTLIIQMLNACLTIAIIRRFLLTPLLKLLDMRNQHKATMEARIVQGELEVNGVHRTIEWELESFRNVARQTIKRERAGEEGLLKSVEKALKVSKKLDISSEKVTSEDVNTFVERVLDGFV